MLRTLISSTLLLLCSSFACGGSSSDNVANPEAVREVMAGKRTEANASWWGFDPDDSTEFLQAAIKSGAKKLIVPNMGRDWIVRPIQLAGNQELVFEKGVVVTAKRGEYRERGDSVFRARDVSHLTIRGEGATVRMQKEDYIVGIVLKDLGWNRWFGPYVKAEWRMCLALQGCSDVTVSGITLRDSGGDGIYIDDGRKHTPCKNIRLENVVCDNNYRQGISIISVDGFVADHCTFKNTWGTPPSSGVDIEPDSPDHQLKGIVFRDCAFLDNYGDGIEVFLTHQTKKSADVSILFEDCHVSSTRGAGIRVAKVHDDGPGGSIEFRNCTIEDTQAYGIKVQDKSSGSARVRFVKCRLRNVALDKNYHDEWTPILFHPARGNKVKTFGGIDFIECSLDDRYDRPAIMVVPNPQASTLNDLTGKITVGIRHRAKSPLASNLHGVSLDIQEAKP